MSTLNSRGHEVVDPVPFEPTVPIRKHLSVADMVRAEIMRARAAADDEIKDENDMVEDMTDFEVDAFPDDLIGPSPYEIGDDVPDRLEVSHEDAETPQAVLDVPPTQTASETPPEA